jgi:hypothetical protein
MDELERILEQDESIEPSSGLTEAVMRAVLDEAAASPPVPFPWKRMIVGMGVCVGLLAAGVVVALIQGLPQPSGAETRSLGALLSTMSLDPQAAFTIGVPLASILFSLLVLRLSMRAMR